MRPRVLEPRRPAVSKRAFPAHVFALSGSLTHGQTSLSDGLIALPAVASQVASEILRSLGSDALPHDTAVARSRL